MKKSVTLVLVLVFVLSCVYGSPLGTVANAGDEQLHELTFLVQEPHTAQYLKTMEDYERQPVWQAMQEMMTAAGLKLTFEIVSAEQYPVIVQTRMASASDLPDIVNATPLGSAGIISIAKHGVVQDLVPLIEQYSNGNINNFYDDEFSFAKALSLTEDGRMYWFCSMYKKQYEDKLSPTGVTFSIRKDWLDKVGMAAPETIDDFYNVLLAFREQDANGNGQADEILAFDFSDFNMTVPQIFGLASSVASVDVAEKKAVSPWYQDGIKPYIEYVRKLIEAGIVDPSLIGSAEITNQRKAENRVSGQATWVTIADQNLLTNVTAEGAEGITLRPFNAIENTPLYTYSEEPQGVFNYYTITNQCDDLEAAIKFFDTIYSQEFALLSFRGIEGVTYNENEDGVKLTVESTEKLTVEQVFEQKVAVGTQLWYQILPRVQFMDFRSELLTIPERPVEIAIEMAQNEHWYPMYAEALMAMPTDEEAEKISDLLNGITSYSQELITKLCLSQLSLDDWDSYMKEFEALGLPELLEIYQARVDRYNENVN